MKLAAFNATCPFEIGDKITERREIHPTGLAFLTARFSRR